MRSLLPILTVLLASAGRADAPEPPADPVRPAGLEPAPPDTDRRPFPAEARHWVDDFDAWSADHPTHRLHATLERPLVRPGEAVEAAIWSVVTRGMRPVDDVVSVTLTDPRGTTMASQYLHLAGGVGAVRFPLSPQAPGGTYTLQMVSTTSGDRAERTLVVADPETPRIEKTLTFPRASYGPGEQVRAALTLSRSTGEPLANVVAVAQLQVGGRALDPFDVRTDARGEATLTFTLPTGMTTPDAVLLVRVDDGGGAEAISRPVPVTLDQVRVAWFPEGGDLVAGLTSRVYFEATDAHGAPASVRGAIRDDRGRTVARFESWVDGRGHVPLTPAPGRTYHAVVDGREGRTFPLPPAASSGCTLRHHDDLDGEQRAVRVSVACTESRDVVVFALQQEQVFDRAAIHVDAGRPTTVHLRSRDPALAGAQGVARVTVFGDGITPLAERLVYRNRGRDLGVRITPDREVYAPGETVALELRTTDPDGRPVPAVLAVAVVDDALLTYADDDQHHLVSQVQLNAVLPEPIPGVADLFDPDEEDGGLGLDLILGTRGWRRFDWRPVVGYAATARARVKARAVNTETTATAMVLTKEFLQRIPPGRTYQSAVQTVPVMAGGAGGNPNMAGGASNENVYLLDGANVTDPRRAPVREHAPPLRVDHGVRTNLRDAVLWAPAVRTDARGRAHLELTLSDAVTGFRAIAEGAGGGAVGRGQATFASVLPLSVDLRLPPAVSAGDRLLLPVTVTNRGRAPADVDLDLEVEGPIALDGAPREVTVPAGEKRTVHVPVVAQLGQGTAALAVTARAGDRADVLRRELTVAPRGFPAGWSASGTLTARRPTTHEVAIPEAVPGSLTARLTVLPSVVATLTEGLEAMIRTPGGCFEQTSSTNYPNVLALDLLDRTGRGRRLAVDRERVLDAGYQRLTGYQVASGGFETFGQGPGKEALSAYGLLQFTDMARVYPVSTAMLDETARYLLGQRTGAGGYRVTGASAHGYGTAPPEVLDAYITYALVETGHRDLPREIEASAALARTSRDPYRLALATLTLLAVRPEEGKAAAARLAALQAKDGSFPGSETSITRSENQNLLVEATSLAAIALIRAGDLVRAREAVDWILRSQTQAGRWGATQGNALALKAIVAMSEAASTQARPGQVTVAVDGREVAAGGFAAGQPGPLALDLGVLAPGARTVAVALDGGEVPYALEFAWNEETPAASEARRVDLATALSRTALRVGETARLTVRLSDRTDEVVPEPIARVGLPAGLVPQTWQLEQLKEQGKVAFFETRPREVTLYWHGVAPGEVHEVALDLVAEVPGTFEGPASSAYPYYDDEAKAWVAGLEVDIAP